MLDQPEDRGPETTARAGPATPWSIRLRFLLLFLVGVFGLAVSVFLYRALLAKEDQLVKTRFHFDAESRGWIIQREFADNVEVLSTVAAFYAGSELVKPDEFQAFTAPLRFEHPGVESLEWAPRVTAAGRAAHEQGARQGGRKDYRIFERDREGRIIPAAERKEYFPVYFAQPGRVGQATEGFDLGSDPAFFNAIHRARKTGRPVAMDRVPLGANGGLPHGLFVVMPIFSKTVSEEAAAEPRKNLEGFVLGVFNIDDIVDDALSYREPAGIDVHLFDTSAGAGRQLLCARLCNDSGVPSAPLTEPPSKPPRGLSHTFNFNLADRAWLVYSVPTDAYLASRRTWGPAAVLGAGLLISGLGVAYLGILIRQTVRVERLVRRRTAQLEHANADLKSEIDQRQRAERALTGANCELERSNRDSQQFAYVASHDLQEPLRMVASYLQLLTRRCCGQLDEEAQQFIDVAVDGAKRMQTLIDDLLIYSRVGKRDTNLGPVDCNHVVDEAVNNLEATMTQLGAVVERGPLPTITADHTELVQLFQNLIGNAVKFHGEESPHVQISVEEEPHEWRFSVRDNGIGMEQKYADRVFTIFQRLHTRDQYPGTGVGLAICKRIVDRYQGRIWFESEPGAGTTFHFTFPRDPRTNP